MLIVSGVRFPRVHDLVELLRLVRDSGIATPGSLEEVADLNPFAVQARYPGWGEPATEDDLEQALRVAHAVINWAAAIVDSR